MEDAEEAGLKYINDGDLSITRKLNGERFVYVLPSGRRVKDARTKARTKRLASIGKMDNTDIVKGYEVEDNEYVILEPDEIDAAGR